MSLSLLCRIDFGQLSQVYVRGDKGQHSLDAIDTILFQDDLTWTMVYRNLVYSWLMG